MRRCATIAAIALCGALAVSSAAPAFAAAHTPVVSTPGVAGEATDRWPGDDPKGDIKTDLAEMKLAELKKKLDQLVADAKKDAEKGAADTKEEAAKDVADAKKEAAELLKGIAPLVKDDLRQDKLPSGA